MSDKQILSRRQGPLGHLIFNNPERHNAVSLAMWKRAGEVLEEFSRDDAVRVIIVSGAGGKAFISGADISKFEEERSTDDARAAYERTSGRTRAILSEMEKPTIAMIQGWCLGGGLALAASCDLRICTDTAKFGIPAAKLGIGYGFSGLKTLENLVGSSRAKEIVFTARHYSAQEALQIGLVTQVVPASDLETYVTAYAETIATNAPLTIRAAKRILDEIVKDPADRDLALCQELVEICGSSQDFVEGRTAFMEKRKPVFTGK